MAPEISESSASEPEAPATGDLSDAIDVEEPTGFRAFLQPARVADALTLLVVGALHRLYAEPFQYANVSRDERFFLWQGWALGKGMVPYRDFQEYKPPMIFIVNMLALKIFGIWGMHYRLFFSFLSLAAYLAIAAALLTRKVGRIVIVAALAYFMAQFFDRNLHDSGINDAESPAVAFFMMGTGVLLAKTRLVKLQQIVGALLLAFVPLTKEPLAPAIVLAWLTFLLLYKREATEPNPGRWFAIRTLSTVAVVVLTWLVYMLVTHSLSWYFVQLRESFTYTAQFAYSQGRERHLTGFPAFYDSVWQLNHGLATLRLRWAFLPMFGAALAFGRSRKWIGIAAGLSFLATLYAITIGHCFWKHYFMMAIPGAVLFGSFGLVFASDALAGLKFERYWRALLAVGCAAAAILPLGDRTIKAYQMLGYYPPVALPVSETAADLVRENSAPGDTIWSLGDPLLYVVTDRKNAVREGSVLDDLIDLRPGNTDEEKLAGERAELDANPPKLVVYVTNVHDKRARYMKALVTPFLDAHGYTLINEKGPHVYSRPD